MKVGLLGWPVAHSVSPAMHNAAFAECGITGQYDLLPVSPERLGEGVGELLAAGYVGFNVTVPHKKAVVGLPQVSTVSEAVRAMGAANTLTLRDGGLQAENTDWRGLRDDLLAHQLDPVGWQCLILGTGGSAQAAAYTLRQMGAAGVRFVSRSPDPGMLGYGQLEGVSADLILNCTPVGMHPHTAEAPWPTATPLPEGAALYDLIYNPPVTRLMHRARQQGHRAVGGLGMLARQGALAFAEWTGVSPPLDIMMRAARAALTP